MLFSAPIEVLDDLLRSLRDSQRRNYGLPHQVLMPIEYPLPEAYVEIGKIIGMDWVK